MESIDEKNSYWKFTMPDDGWCEKIVKLGDP